MSSIVIDLPRMVDLALGTPELGQVNFNILHSFLHILINHSNLNSYKVELQATEKNNYENLLSLASKSNSINVIEYEYEGDDMNNRSAVQKNRGKNSNKIAVIHDKVKVGTTIMSVTDLSQSAVEIASASDVRNLQIKVQNINDVLTNVVPGTDKLMQHIRDGKKGNPFTDMFNILNMNKRIDALEIAITKVIKLVNDLAREHVSMENSFSPYHKPGESGTCDDSEEQENGQGGKKKTSGRRKMEKPVKIYNDQISESGISDMNFETDTEYQKEGYKKNTKMQGTPGEYDSSTGKEFDEISSLGEIRSQESVMQGKARRLNAEITKLKKEMKKILQLIGVTDPKKFKGLSAISENDSDTQFDDGSCMDNLGRICQDFEAGNKARKEAEIDKKLREFEDIIKAVEKKVVDSKKEIARVKKDVEDNGDILGNHLENYELKNCELDERFTNIENNTIENQDAIEELRSDVEVIQKEKVQMDHFEKRLNEKADFELVQSKVSYTEFNDTKQSLSKSIAEVYAAHIKAEKANELCFTELREELLERLKKIDFGTFKDFTEDKLKKLQERIVKLAELNHEGEAAGTKTFLRDVNCVSCDNRSVMKIFQECSPKPDVMPPSRSLKPFLAFELDHVRKHMLNSKSEKNLHYLENTMKTDAKCQKSRFCGGDYTTQKVASCKFQRCWTVPAPGAAAHTLMGTDGQLYKGAANTQAKVNNTKNTEITKTTPNTKTTENTKNNDEKK